MDQKNLPEDDTKIIQDEIQQNYRQLQKKLSLEFQEKLSEWEKMNQNSPGTSIPSSACGFVDESKDSAFIKKMEAWQKLKSQPSVKIRTIPMTSEENLPPEFRKKLQEWEKIRKFSGKECPPKKKLGEVPRWKSLSGSRSENVPVFEYPPISEDFKKKLEEWKQIKSGGSVVPVEDNEKRSKDFKSSPRLIRKDISPKHSKKHKDPHDKELQWFEKELGKIEKEKQRLERERQRFLEREENLTKLRSSVIGGLKKEVLIHTPSGFYRFEGISHNTSPLVRSKSADSIAKSAFNLSCPLMSHQPSSLSLNDVDELEKECLADSKSSSMQFLSESHETLALDEPEALIVEVEDIIEETAAPLHAYAQRTQQPVYQRQELNTIEGETCAAPKIRRSESARAQNNYNLIEEIFSILKNLTENELEIQKTQDMMAEQEKKANSDIIKLKMFDESQKAMANRLCDKVIRLQEANANVFSSITNEVSQFNVKHIIEIFETVQDLSSEIFQLRNRCTIFEPNNRSY
ncbi:myosin-11 [Asbolus verrucosus]|uniref:Myosin-11 n=1 Tax=Asbolus verrucosus TaxID=1661398 RepID=A0A482WBA9_ASBVE|nr:myosin-11 [Asbolus verrucosus]